jgi:DNA-binding transcriptional regulator YiaG
MKNLTQEKLPTWAIQIKTVRRSLQESQAEFGLRWGVTKQAVSFWENGIYEPPAAVIVYVFGQIGITRG